MDWEDYTEKINDAVDKTNKMTLGGVKKRRCRIF